jgi:hypothetical protein
VADADDTKNKEWELELDKGKKDEVKEFRRSLGRSLATKRQTVFVGSDDLWERVYDKAAVAFTESGTHNQRLKKGCCPGDTGWCGGGPDCSFPNVP